MDPAHTRTSSVSDRGSLAPDVAGFACAALLALLAVLASRHSGGDPGPTLALVGGVVAAVIVGRLVSLAGRAVVPAAVAVVTATVAVASRSDLFSSWALSGPFGYANAKSAFFATGAVAGLALALLARRAPFRVAGVVVALVSAGVAYTSRTESVASLVPLAALGLLARTARGVRVFVWACALLLAGALAASFLIALWSPGDRTPLARLAARTLSERRLVLWHEAWTIAIHHPATGVGSARFQFVSPTARSDRDSRWAHNEFLQTAAEVGVPGLIALAGVFAWGLAVSLRTAPAGRQAALSAAAVTLLGVQACVDYVLHFPAIPISCAFLVGGLTRSRISSRATHAHDQSRDAIPHAAAWETAR